MHYIASQWNFKKKYAHRIIRSLCTIRSVFILRTLSNNTEEYKEQENI